MEGAGAIAPRLFGNLSVFLSKAEFAGGFCLPADRGAVCELFNVTPGAPLAFVE
jgi:hypothetical protein